MIRTKYTARHSLLAVTLTALTACGGSNNTSNNSTDHPVFKWTDAGVSNNYLPLGNITNPTPTFSWPAYTDSGSRANEYNFGYQRTNGDGWTEYTVSAADANCSTGNTCTYKPGNLVFNVGDQRVWWVRGSINGNWQEWSSAHVFKVVGAQPPTAGNYQPSGDTATTQPTFKWPRVGSNSSYELGMESQAGSGWKSFNPTCSSSICSYTPNAGLSVGDRMTWWVRPAGGAWSDGIDFNIIQGGGGSDTQSPTTPSNLRKTAATSTSASFRWNASSDNVAVTGYRVYRNAQLITTVSGTSITDSGLSPNTTYIYSVRALDAAGNLSGNSSNLSISTQSGGSNTIQAISWSPINGATQYELGMEKTNGSNWQSFVKTSAELNCQSGTCSTAPHNSFKAGDQVLWWVRAFVNGSWQAWSNTHRATLTNGGGADTQAPTTPANLRQVSVTQTSAVIRWNASTDNTAVTGYRVYRNGSQIGTATGTTYTDNSVSAGNSYSYRVLALDAAGNQSAQSAVLSVNTPPNIPLADVVINEVLAGNTVTNMDTDFYKFSDWVELHNTTNQPQNISGFYLSDDTAKPRKWKIPAGTTLAAHQYLLIWADKKDVKAKELHANFSLSSKGETLTLANASGTIVDTLTFGKIDAGVSAGKSGNKVVYYVPTPKAQNSSAYSSKKGAKEPGFSHRAGFFGSRLNLSLSQENNGTIYYTRDGSTPTSSSTRYTGPITLDKTTVVKAVAIESSKLPSKVVTNTYFINHQSNLPVVSLSMQSDYLFDDTVGIYTVGTNGTPHTSCNNVVANYAQDWDRPVFVEYFDQNQTRALAFGADTGLTGECSRRKAKKSFGFELDGKYGTKSLSYKLFPGKNLGKIKDFKIRTANSGYRVGDIVGAQLIEQGGLDIDYQAYRAVQMFMNGEYWGIYNIREKKGAETLEANYPNLGKVDIIKAFIVKRGDYTDYGRFNTFLTTHDLATNANYQQALNFFDEKSFIDYMAFMIYNGNLDWIGGNMRTWKEKKAGAKWRWMADDIDWGFLSQIDFAGNGTALASNQFNNIKNSGSTTNMVLLFNGLMKNNTFRAKFKTRFNTLLNTVFTPDFMLPIVNSINDERKDYMHLEKFAGMPAGDYVASYTDYIENDIRAFVRARTSLVKQQLEQAIP